MVSNGKPNSGGIWTLPAVPGPTMLAACVSRASTIFVGCAMASGSSDAGAAVLGQFAALKLVSRSTFRGLDESAIQTANKRIL